MANKINIYQKCARCHGTGQVDELYSDRTCPSCGGIGHSLSGDLDTTEYMASIDTLTAKVDAIKAMLDSAICGLQKMSSNLDDIMVKLDV